MPKTIYDQSSLFNAFCESDDKEEVAKVFDKELERMNINRKQFKKFVKNCEKIVYTKDNIFDWLNCSLYFGIKVKKVFDFIFDFALVNRCIEPIINLWPVRERCENAIRPLQNNPTATYIFNLLQPSDIILMRDIIIPFNTCVKRIHLGCFLKQSIRGAIGCHYFQRQCPNLLAILDIDMDEQLKYAKRTDDVFYYRGNTFTLDGKQYGKHYFIDAYGCTHYNPLYHY